ncbi:MAG: hypothetical protein ACREDT_05280 [Methylocella sp.]
MRDKRVKVLILSKFFDLICGRRRRLAYVALRGQFFIVGAIALFLIWRLFAVRALPGP